MLPSASNIEHFLSEARGLFQEREAQEVAAAESLIAEARTLVESHVVRAMAEASAPLALYDDQPQAFDLFGTLGVTTSETVHNNLLAWILDPEGNHGLGDAVLRRFLSRLKQPCLVQRAACPAPLKALVQREVAVGTGYLDILVTLPGVLLSIECKVWSQEHTVKDPGREAMQTTYYRETLEDAEAREASLSPDAAALMGAFSKVVGVFVRPKGRDSAQDGDKTASLSWLDIERDLGEALARAPVGPTPRSLLNHFRSTLLESTGSIEPLMPQIQHLRLLADAPTLQQADPIGTYLRLRRFLGEDEADG